MKRATHSYTLILYQGGNAVLTLLFYYAKKLNSWQTAKYKFETQIMGTDLPAT